jgi:hypothetical protein
MNLIETTQKFGTDEQCLAYLVAMRWPNGIRCMVCGNDKISTITRQSKTKNKRNTIYACLEPTCKHQFSATTGTLFHDSHLPLNKWFLAVALIADAKKSMSAVQIQKHLGIGSYRTAWYMVHRIRKSMQNDGTKLKGTVELDETYISGKAKIRGRKRSKREGDVVFGMVERGGQVRFHHVLDTKVKTLKPIIDRYVRSDVRRIMTDQSVIYDFALDKANKKRHFTVNHSKEYVVPGTDTHTNTIESAFSLLKRGLIGSFHFVSIKHLHRYLSEFEYRFNNRKNADLFSTVLRRMTNTPEMPYKQLISEA